MGFYDLSKEEREKLVEKINKGILVDLNNGNLNTIKRYASDSDTYIRKTTYLSLGRIYKDQKVLRNKILTALEKLSEDQSEKVRQTITYSLGEIGKINAENVLSMLERALFDDHHAVRNAVIGSLKQMGEKNPKPTLMFAKKFLNYPDPKIRREIIHGIELRGRTHPEDVLPLLKMLQNDPDKNIKETIVHVLGQISYKKDCLEKVVESLKLWENKELVNKSAEEILSVHRRYEKFSAKSYKEAKEQLKRIN